MDPFNPQKKRQLEKKIQNKIGDMLERKGWFVKDTHGSMFSSGWPDVYASHKVYGIRWIEVKLPKMKGSKFTPAQLDVFPKFTANGSGIWILTADTQSEYDKLFKDYNWHHYLYK